MFSLMRPKLLLFGALLSAFCHPVVAGDFQHPAPVHLDRDGERWAKKTLKKLSLEEKIGQMIMIRVLGQFMDLQSPDYLKLHDQIARYHLGSILLTVPAEGPFLYKTGPYEAAMLINQLQHDVKVPLIVGADFERGLSMRLTGVTTFPHAMAFGAAGKPEFAEKFGKIVGEESRAIGVEWNFFPVADVNSNPENPIINTRAFGEDPDQVSQLVAAYIRGARQQGMLTTAKHFPGHGDTATDSHLGLAAVNRSRDQIKQIDLVPFRAAIAAGVDSVMVAHVTVPALEPDPGKVATTSPAIVGELLHHQLAFTGLVVTDAMEMGGLTRLYPPGNSAAGHAAVDAVKAGNDMLLLPSDLEGAYKGLLSAVRQGELPESRINDSVLKILRAKASVGLNKARLVDLNSIPVIVAKPQSLDLAQNMANASITLVRENGHVLPFTKNHRTSPTDPAYAKVESQGSSVVCVILTDDIRTDYGRQFERELRRRVPDAKVIYIDSRIAGSMAPVVENAVNAAEKVIVAVYVVPTAGKKVKTAAGVVNSIGLAQTPAALLQSILDNSRDKTVVVSFGSPYLAKDFPQVENYMCAYSPVPTSEIAVARALFGEIPIQGHLPVTIPGYGPRGAGIQKPAATASMKEDL
ncbi:MAG TPA: glycoside hydrolase family 3 N-terminal domain-containing protein [Candidatus Angelobacter sp.]